MGIKHVKSYVRKGRVVKQYSAKKKDKSASGNTVQGKGIKYWDNYQIDANQPDFKFGGMTYDNAYKYILKQIQEGATGYGAKKIKLSTTEIEKLINKKRKTYKDPTGSYDVVHKGMDSEIGGSNVYGWNTKKEINLPSQHVKMLQHLKTYKDPAKVKEYTEERDKRNKWHAEAHEQKKAEAKKRKEEREQRQNG